MTWSNEQLTDHQKAADLLNEIKDSAFAYIASHPNTTEYEVQQLIVDTFKQHGLRSGMGPPIVAFNESAAEPHYFPPKRGSKKLTDATLLLIDIWARLAKPKAPYADITWMGYYGRKVPPRIQKAFDTVIQARDTALGYIKRELEQGNLPVGKAVDLVTEDVIRKAGYGAYIKHRTGHSLGVANVHGHRGKYSLSIKNEDPIKLGIGYTIEPGIYIDGRFGIRSEIDIFLSKSGTVRPTTTMQNAIVQL